MKHELPELPERAFHLRWSNERAHYYVDKPNIDSIDVFTGKEMRQYAEQAVAPLLAEIERLNAELDDVANFRDCRR